MTEPTLDPTLRQQVLDLSNRSELPEFGTPEWLEFQRDLTTKDPEIAEALIVAMREDDDAVVPPGLVRHLRRAKNRETVNTLKRNATQRQAPDGRWVPNKNTAVIAVGVVALLGAFGVLTAQRAGAKPSQSANLLSGAVGIAGRGEPASGVPSAGVAGGNSSSASTAARDATIPVQPSQPLFGGTTSSSSGETGAASTGKTPFTPTAAPVPSDSSSAELEAASQNDPTNRPQYSPSLTAPRSSVSSANSGVGSGRAASGLSRTVATPKASSAGSLKPQSAPRSTTAASQASKTASIRPTMKIGFAASRPQTAPPTRVAASPNQTGAAPPVSSGFAQTGASSNAAAVQPGVSAQVAPSVTVAANPARTAPVASGTNPPRPATVDPVTARPGATTVFRTDGAPASGSSSVAYSRSADTSASAAQQPGAMTSVYRREPNATTPGGAFAALEPSPFAPPPASASVPVPTPTPPAATPAQASSVAAALPATLKPGARVAASLVTTVYAAESAVVPVVASSPEGLWIGRATLGAAKRIEISFDRLIDPDGSTFAVQALVFDTNLTQGLACSVDLVAPTLASDLLQSGLSGLSTYLGGQFGSGTTTTAPSGATTQTRAAPSLLDSVLGQIGGLFKLPDGAAAIVRVARVEKDTPMVVLYGVNATTSSPPKP